VLVCDDQLTTPRSLLVVVTENLQTLLQGKFAMQPCKVKIHVRRALCNLALKLSFRCAESVEEVLKAETRAP